MPQYKTAVMPADPWAGIKQDFAFLASMLYGNEKRTRRTLTLCALAIAYSVILNMSVQHHLAACAL